MSTSKREPSGRTRNLRSFILVAGCVAASMLSEHVRADTTLTVDLAMPIGPATHAGSGSLYGVTEKLPMDVDKLIAPLHPKVFTNPAADQQQPVGDAIVVAGRLAPIGASVMIRLADWFKGWPYQFTSMSDWFKKLAETVQRKQASGLTNYYGYEIWNEPNGTWKSSSPSFNDFWAQTYAELRRLEPNVKIVGPSMAGYNSSWITDFLTYCKEHQVLPDIVSWHELSGEPLTADLQNYRSLEKKLGIGPLPISINEYSGAGWQTDEGKPGTSAPMIAKFERFQVDSACISYWDVAHAGRLGSLLATDSAPNGGWWFYKWYGDMTGNMVTTIAPSPANATALDGFANLDAGGASVLFGGVNDGVIKIVVKGFQSSGIFGQSVHAVVERTPWVDKSTVVNSTTVVSMSDVEVEQDQISVSVPGANNVDGFRLSLTPVGGPPPGRAGTGGASGTGGAADGGARATASGSGGAVGGAGSGGAGGVSGAGGRAPQVGGGAAAASGTLARGGNSGSAGVSAMSAGGTVSVGSLPKSGAPSIQEVQSPASYASSDSKQSGCSCRVVRTSSSGGGLMVFGMLAATLRARSLRRRRRRRVGPSSQRPRRSAE